MPSPRRPDPHEEPLEDLPPIDGGEDESASEEEELTDIDVPEEETDPFDDRTGEDEPAEVEVAGREGGWLEEADEAAGLDIGDADLLTEQSDLLSDNDEPGAGAEDYGLGDSERDTGHDGGEEGPGDADEELREEDLPRLDADEGGAPDDEDFIDANFGDADDTPVPWDRQRWSRVGPALSVGPTVALVAVPRGVLAGGVGLWRVDLEGGAERLEALGLEGEDVTSLGAASDAWIAVAEGPFVSRDEGKTFQAAPGWRAVVRAREIAAHVELALAGADLWGRTANGGLLFSPDRGTTFQSVEAGGFVAALAADAEGGAVVAVRGLRGFELRRAKAGKLAGLPGSLVIPSTGVGFLLLAARGPLLAVAGEGTRACFSLDAGATWSSAPGTESATALAWSHDGTLFVGLRDGPQERTFLGSISSAGEAKILAEITGMPADLEGGISAILVDTARGVVWTAGTFGVAAFQPP